MAEESEKIQELLKQVVDHFDDEDRSVREKQIRQAKKLKYYWNGFQRVWWSEVAHDWRVFEETEQVEDPYDKPVNIFRAYLESIIAALSITIPSVRCFPDDADNPLDLATARAGDKIADLVAKHNDVALLWLHALFIYCTEGMVACYNYTKEDYEFGSYNVDKTEEKEEEQDVSTCPDCGNELPPALENSLRDEFNPGDEDIEIHDLLNSGNFCVNCMAQVMPIIEKKTLMVTRLVGITTKPKARQCLEVYGSLFVKVPHYARKQPDIPYLIFAYETHFSNAMEMYKDLKDKFTNTSKIAGHSGIDDPYEQWGRLSTQYAGDYPINTVTIRNCWLRPSSFNILNDEDEVKLLKKKFPDGARVVYVNELYAESENENLDDHWTLTNNPLSDYIHFDPLGLLLTSIQEITNELISLILQTIEHGIPQTFADPAIVNFEAYRKNEVSPGSIYPTKATSSSKQIGDGFFTIKTATLSAEVLPFAEKTQELGQLVSGALPSLFGGVQAGGSKTAAAYAMSRSQALQRLQTTWKMFNVWWKQIFGKVIPAYIQDVHDDEKIVEKDDSNNFVNVFIRRADLQGKIGSVELESSEEFPTSWSQKKDVIMQLLQGTNPEIMAAITDPQNIPFVKAAIGLDDFAIPGEDDREKQYEEIKLLLQSGPIGPNQPSVPTEPMVDNAPVHADICKRYLVGPSGRLAKTENPEGYQNVLFHLAMHVTDMQPPPGAIPQGAPGKVPPAAVAQPKGPSNVSPIH